MSSEPQPGRADEANSWRSNRVQQTHALEARHGGEASRPGQGPPGDLRGRPYASSSSSASTSSHPTAYQRVISGVGQCPTSGPSQGPTSGASHGSSSSSVSRSWADDRQARRAEGQAGPAAMQPNSQAGPAVMPPYSHAGPAAMRPHSSSARADTSHQVPPCSRPLTPWQQENEKLVLTLKELLAPMIGPTPGRPSASQHAALQQLSDLMAKHMEICRAAKASTKRPATIPAIPANTPPSPDPTSTTLTASTTPATSTNPTGSTDTTTVEEATAQAAAAAAVSSQLPFTLTQLSRVALSLSKLARSSQPPTSTAHTYTSTATTTTTTASAMDSRAEDVCLCFLVHPELRLMAMSTWCSLLYGLVSAGYTGNKLQALMDVAVECLPRQLDLGADVAQRHVRSRDMVGVISQCRDQQAKELIREMNPKHLPANVCKLLWALAKVEYEGNLGPLLDALGRLVKTGNVMKQATGHDYTQMLWAVVKLSRPEGEEHVEGDTPDGHGVVVGRALMEVAVAGVTCALEDNAASTQDIGNSAWAMAYAPRDLQGARQLLHTVALAVQRGAMERATLQEWWNTVWALGKLGVGDDAELVLPAATRCFLNRAHLINQSQGLGNMLWGLAQLGCCDDDVLYTAVRVLPDLLPGATPQDLSNSLWALGKMTPAGPQRLRGREAYGRLLSGLARAVAHKLSQPYGKALRGALPQNWSNICWGMAALEVYEPSVFSTCLQYTAAHAPHDIGGTDLAPVQGLVQVPRPLGLIALDISSILWAAATCAHMGDPAARQLFLHLNHMDLKRFECRQVANLPYSWAVLWGNGSGSAEQEVAAMLFTEAASRDPCDYTDVGLTQLAQAHVEAVQSGVPCGGLPSGAVRDAAMALWIERRDQVTVSGFQQEVVSELKAAGFTSELEALSPDSMHRVDALVTQLPDSFSQLPGSSSSSCHVILECDGPFHLLQQPIYRILGSTVLRHRALRRHGAFACIPWIQWKQLQGAAARQEYVTAVIRLAHLRGKQCDLPEVTVCDPSPAGVIAEAARLAAGGDLLGAKCEKSNDGVTTGNDPPGSKGAPDSALEGANRDTGLAGQGKGTANMQGAGGSKEVAGLVSQTATLRVDEDQVSLRPAMMSWRRTPKPS